MNPTVPQTSIIIITYNGRKFIKDLLTSLSQQSYPEERFEVLVVDNASEDDTVEMANKYAHDNMTVIQLDANYGFAGGNNTALKYVKSEFVVFLNQDTICHKEWLSGLVNTLLENPEIGACTSNMIMSEFPYTGDYSSELIKDKVNFYDITRLGYGRYYKNYRADKKIVYTKIISGCSFLIRRQTIEQLGYLFDEDLVMYNEDTELSLRLHNMGYKTCVCRDSIVYHLHSKKKEVSLNQALIAGKAIKNRIDAFFINMSITEFLLFLPFLFLGSFLKIFELRIPGPYKILFFIPFSIFSFICMSATLFVLPRSWEKHKKNLLFRKEEGFPILRLLLKF